MQDNNARVIAISIIALTVLLIVSACSVSGVYKENQKVSAGLQECQDLREDGTYYNYGGNYHWAKECQPAITD